MKIGDSVPFYVAVHRKSTPKGRGPAKIIGVDDAGSSMARPGVAKAKFLSQTLKAVRYCVRRQASAQDVGGVDWNPASEAPDFWGGIPTVDLVNAQEVDRLSLGRDKGPRSA